MGIQSSMKTLNLRASQEASPLLSRITPNGTRWIRREVTTFDSEIQDLGQYIQSPVGTGGRIHRVAIKPTANNLVAELGERHLTERGQELSMEQTLDSALGRWLAVLMTGGFPGKLYQFLESCHDDEVIAQATACTALIASASSKCRYLNVVAGSR